MNKEKSEKFKNLILAEMNFRKEFREARQKLESLVSPITRHNIECNKFWNENLKNADEVLVIMDNGISLKIIRPKLEDCKVESYLPFSMDYTECTVINIQNTDNK